jgi:hypothetical protein
MEKEMDTKVNIAYLHIYEEKCKTKTQCLKESGLYEDEDDVRKKLLDNQKDDEAKKISVNIIFSYKTDQ